MINKELEAIISGYEKHLRDGFKELAKQLRKWGQKQEAEK